jgi:uncharacterized membrane protein YedE/YeeE
MNEFPATPKRYMNPYLAGIGLGLVLLTAYVVMGRGLGASGAFTSVVAAGVNTVAPSHAQSSKFYKEYLPVNASPFKDWLVFEVAGVIVGGLISGLFAGRVKRTVDRGPRSSVSMRLTFALAGGVIMGFGSKLARGCTSGQALTGGAVLSVGSWTFMLAVFAGAYAVAYFLRRQWV